MFIKNQSKVYTGMVFGEHIKENDLELNPAKEKKLTNIRTVLVDDAIKL
jgi:GTP-binding protein